MAGVITTLQPRSKTLQEMADQSRFYFTDTIDYDEKAAKKFLKANVLEPLNALVSRLSALPAFSEKDLEELFKQLLLDFDIKLGKIAQPVRVALTGTSVSPGIFEIITVLGRDRVMQRLASAIDYIERRMARAAG